VERGTLDPHNVGNRLTPLQLLYLRDSVQGDQKVSIVQDISVTVAVEDAVGEVTSRMVVHLLEKRHAGTAHPRCVKHQPTVTAGKCRQMMVNARVRHVHDGLYLFSASDVY